MKKLLLGFLSLLMLACCCFGIACGFDSNTSDDSQNQEPEFMEVVSYGIYSGGKNAYVESVSTRKTEIEIASTYEGVPVTEIYAHAFEDCKTIERVIIPDSITKIGDSAFAGCENLKEIHLSDNVTKLGNSVFKNCISLEKAYLGDGLSSVVGEKNGPIGVDSWTGLFYNCPSLKELSLPFSCVYDLTFSSRYQDLHPINRFFGGPQTEEFVSVRQEQVSGKGSGWEKQSSVTVLVPKALTCIEFRNKFVEDYAIAGWNHLETIKLDKATTASKAFTYNDAPYLTIFAYNDAYLYGVPYSNNYMVFADSTCSVSNVPSGNLVKNFKELKETEDGFTYAITESNKAFIYKYEGSATELEIYPTMFDGCQVETVLSNCFSNNNTLQKVVIDKKTDSSISLSASTFNNCSALEEIKTVGCLLEDKCINGCNNLKKLTLEKITILYTKSEIIFNGNSTITETINGADKSNYTFKNIFNGQFNGKIDVDFVNLVIIATTTITDATNKTNSTTTYTGIIPKMFYGCDFIKQLSITCSNNAKIKYIGKSAFEGCTNLTSIKIDVDDLTICERAFYGCEKLQQFDGARENTWQYEPTTVGDNAFYNCKKLNDIKGIYITTIGEYAFKNCSALTALTSEYQQGGLNVSRTTSIGKGSFYGSGLEKIDITENTQTIGEKAFANCQNLVDIELPYLGENKTSAQTFAWLFEGFDTSKEISVLVLGGSIAKQAFGNYVENTKNLKVALESIVNVGDRAFYDSTFDEVQVHDISGTFGSEVFYKCNVDYVYVGKGCFVDQIQFNRILVSSNNTYYSAQDNVLYNKNKTTLYKYPEAKQGETFAIPSTVNKIASSAFAENKYLQKIVIPDNVLEIESNAFSNSALKYVDVGNGVTKIGDGAFFGCNLNTLIIGTNVSYLGMSVVNLEGSGTLIQGGSQIFFTDIRGMVNKDLKIYYRGTEADWEKIVIVGPDTIDSSQYTENALWSENWALYKAEKYWYSESNLGDSYWHYGQDGSTPEIWENA